MSGLTGTLRSSNEAVAHPVCDGLPGFQCGISDEFVFGCGEAHAADLGSRVLDVRSAHSGCHARQLYGPRKELDKTHFAGHNKYMTTTAAMATIFAKTDTDILIISALTLDAIDSPTSEQRMVLAWTCDEVAEPVMWPCPTFAALEAQVVSPSVPSSEGEQP